MPKLSFLILNFINSSNQKTESKIIKKKLFRTFIIIKFIFKLTAFENNGHQENSLQTKKPMVFVAKKSRIK